MRWDPWRSVLLCAALITATFSGALSASAASNSTGLQVYHPVATGISPPLRDLAPVQDTTVQREKTRHRKPSATAPRTYDPVIQSSSAPASSPAPGTSRSFDGVGQGIAGYFVNSVPPDTNGAVGATQYVQWVNASYAVFDKSTGRRLLGPTAGRSIWSSLGSSPCATRNDGDPIAQYDKGNNRWVMTQFALPNQKSGPNYQCVAVSTTSDATGSYALYVYQLPLFNDYPKLGVWSDGYYISFNTFSNNSYVGSDACAMDRAKMVAGNLSAAMLCLQQTAAVGPLLPADVDGSIAPPPGEPGLFLSFEGSMHLHKMTVSWAGAGSASLSAPISIAGAAASNTPCGGAQTCIPQLGTAQQLDTLGDRLMYRLAYRHFADGHEALVVSHSVDAITATGARWYEIRDPNGTPTVYQQGTYAPGDGNQRWMSSIAMDQSGDIAMGYSISGANLNPGIRYVGREVSTQNLGTMTSSEVTLQAGSGSQTGASRWGDYSSMSMDPVDDCTFWYTNEYLTADGTFNWHTRIGSFRFPRCGQWTTVATGSPTSTDWLFGSSCSNSGADSGATAQRCFAAGFRPTNGAAIGDIFRSLSGKDVGTGWQLNATTPANANGLTAISCSPKARVLATPVPMSSTCYAAGGNGLVMKTVNNGDDSWTAPGRAPVNGTPALFGISCGDDTDCWAVGDLGSLWQTRDGATWNNFSLTSPTTPDAFYGVSCTGAATCEAAGSNGLAVHITSADTASPTIVREARPVTTSLNNVSCPGGATTDCIAASDGPGDAFKHAAGLWAQTTAQPAAVTLLGAGCQTFPGADASSVGCSVSGPGGTIYTTSDGGTTWTTDITGTTNELDALDCSLSVTFCLAVGQNGTILRR